MSIARSLERRLEKLIEGAAGRMFSGRLHPAELAGKLAREADFARFDHAAGPATANLFVISIHPRDLTVEPPELEMMLSTELTDYVVEEGLRTAGPIEVKVETTTDVSPGKAHCHVEVVPGPGQTWARLTHNGVIYEIARNRCLIGRGDEADIQLRHDDISRRHAVVYRAHGESWVVDLGSVNGTTVDGIPATAEPTSVASGSTLSFASHSFRIVID